MSQATTTERRRTRPTTPQPPQEGNPETIPAPAVVPLAILYRPLRELVPYARNARTHSARQIVKLRASLGRFGWANPMLIAENGMIAGHGRLIAAIEMAEANQPIPRNPDPWQGPTVDLSHLSPADRRAYVLQDNRSALDGGWDNDLLHLELTDLRSLGLDLTLTGFAATEIDTMLGIGHTSERGLRDGLAYQVVVDATSETHQAELLERFRADGLACKPLIL